jgi:hypothetical protein
MTSHRQCCCPSTDRHECVRWRLGIGLDDYDEAEDEGCTCSCHDEDEDEDIYDDGLDLDGWHEDPDEDSPICVACGRPTEHLDIEGLCGDCTLDGIEDDDLPDDDPEDLPW